LDKPSSYSVAPGDAARQSVLSRGALFGVVAVALLGLVLVFPKEDLLSRLRGDKETGDRELTITYLRNLIRTEQRDVGLRLLLVEKLIETGDFKEAAKILADAKPLLGNDTKLLSQWNTLDTSLAWSVYRAAREKAKTSGNDQDALALEQARAALEQRLRAQLLRIDTAAAGFTLLTQTQDIGSAILSRQVLQSIAKLKTATMSDLLRAGREALALGYFEDAAALYFAAKTRSTDTEARRNAVMLGVKALLAGGFPKEAYQAALRELGPVVRGDTFTWTLIDLALAAGEPRAAAEHLRAVVPPEWDIATLAQKLEPAQLQKALDVALAGGDLPEALKLVQAAMVQKPADAAVLKKAIEIALANGNLPLALQFVQQSLAANPHQPALREQYAQLLEWSGQPAAALAAWLALMRQAATDKAIANVLRLSPMLYDDDALLAAWLATQSRRPVTFDEARRIVDIYERLGQPDKALQFLELLAQSPKGLAGDLAQQSADLRRVQSLRALLYERSGRPQEAIAVLQALRQSTGRLEREDAFRLATLQLKAGKQSAALDALLAYTPLATDKFDAPYWDLVADLAYETGRNDTKLRALRQLLDASTSTLLLRDYQADRLLRYYLDTDNPTEVVALAQRMYPLADTDTLRDSIALTWLDAIVQAPQRPWLSQWQAAIGPQALARLLKNPDILGRRAGIYASLGDKTLAAADYRAALAIRSDTPTRVSYWWLLIDMADAKTLRAELAAAGAGARKDPAFLEVQGASWQFLGESRKALGFYARQTKEQSKAGDYLWLTNYADVLDQAGEGALALRVRRHAFGLLTTAIQRLDSMKKKDAAQALLVRVRLSESFSSGDEKSRLAKLLGQVVSGADLPADLRKQADDLIVSWALGSQNGSGPGGARTELAQRWLWQQQARKVGSTEYAELALALAQGDVQALERLMERSAQKFQQVDQLNALRELGKRQPQRLAQAATLGTELAQREAESPRNDDLQEALEADLLKLASRARVAVVSKKLDSVSATGLRSQANIALTPRLRLTAELGQLNLRSTDTNVLANVPARDRELALGGKLLIEGGEVSASLTQRDAFATVSGMVLKLTQQITSRLSLEATLQKNQRSDDSAALSVAGMQDKAAANLSYSLSKDISLSGELASTRYRSQTGAYLGRSTTAGANITYFLRRDTPDWAIKAGIRRSLNRANGQADAATASLVPGNTIPNASFFVAPSSTSLDLSVGWGLAQSIDSADAYSRGWRPYGELGLERRTTSGQSGQISGLLRLGVRGSVAGRDQLAAGIEVRPTAGGKTSREVRVQYEWIGDR
jgi:polysaccharide biosynthesis protein PelB